MNDNLTDNSNGSDRENAEYQLLNQDLMPYLQNHQRTVRELFLLRLAKGDLKTIAHVSTHAKQLGIQTEECHYVVFIVSPTADTKALKGDLSLCCLKERIRSNKLAEDHLQACCLDTSGRLICIIKVDAPYADTAKLEGMLVLLLKSVEKETSTRLNYGIGAFVDRLELLSESYELAMTVLQHAETLDNNAVLETVNHYLKNSDEIHRYLLKLFRDADVEGISQTVRQHVEMIQLKVPGRQVLVERFAVLYLQNITNECMRLGITLERFESYVPAVVCLMQLDGLGSIDPLLQLTEQILKYISVHRTKESNHLLIMAKDYIRENMGNDKLDLATVGDHVGLSRVYFCKLFHQMEGISFSAYLKKVRIEKAKQLLLTTNMKVFEVSNAVGFSHAKYFGQVFKEVVGQTPIEFQKGIRKDI